MRTTTLTLAAALALGLTGGAFAQTTTAPGAREPTLDNPARMESGGERGLERTTGVPAGNPSQDTTGSIGHPKSTNSNGTTSAPAAR